MTSYLEMMICIRNGHCPDWWLPSNNHRRLGCGESSSTGNPSSQNLTILTICWSVVGQFPLSPLVSIICKLQQKYQCVSLPLLPVHCCISETPTWHMYLCMIHLFTSRPKCILGSRDPGITIVNPTEISVMYGYIH